MRLVDGAVSGYFVGVVALFVMGGYIPSDVGHQADTGQGKRREERSSPAASGGPATAPA